MAERKKKTPEFLTVTARERFLGVKRNDAGMKIVVEDGEDVELPYALAVRMSNAPNSKIAIGDEERKEAKRVAKERKVARDKADKLSDARTAFLEKTLLG